LGPEREGLIQHLDDTDRKILRILLADGSKSKAEVARLVGLTPTAVFERLRKLHERGVILGYTVRLDPRALGSKLLAFVAVEETKPVTTGKTGSRLARVSSVEEVHRVAGKDCFLLKVRVADTGDLTKVLDEIGMIESVGAIETTIVLETFLEKPYGALPS
jgi:Lrp/AsnC family leucine-responsive transcriptional regulator